MTIAKAVSVILVGAIASCSGVAVKTPAAQPSSAQHLPSPDWRDQVIYFAMIDRFADGDPGNNDQGVGEYDPARNSHYSGGDLAGLRQQLDYIQALGATTLWITPPVANQWWNPSRQYTGYHGYWAQDFKSVDRHYGTLAEYQELAQALRGRGMFLLQDIVVNHVGNWFGYDESYVVGDAVRGYVRYGEGTRARGQKGTHEPMRAAPESLCPSHALEPSCPRALQALAPTQPPFHQNDPRDPAQRVAGIYHWTPDIGDYQDPNQEANFQMGGLDDLNTENPLVRRALRDSYGYWIREVGVDGFRVDTAFYVPPAYFEDFLYADDPAAPGIDIVARSTGREHFLNFGEGFAIDPPYVDKAARKIDTYLRSSDGRPRLQGMINFPLYGSLGDVFARGRPTAELADRIEAMLRVHANPHLLPSFIDNHDVDRFLAGGSEAALKQALLAMMTLPGIPVIYYGTEQGFHQQRAAMFAAGYGSGGRDHFDTGSALFQFTRSAIALRRAYPVLSRGTPELLASSAAGAGALAWRMRAGDEQLLVVFNTADAATLLDHLPTGLAPGTRLTEVFAIDANQVGTDFGVRRLAGALDAPSGQSATSSTAPASRRTPEVGADGSLTLVLPPRSGFVWGPVGEMGEASRQGPDPHSCAASGGSGPCPDALPVLTIEPTPTTTYAGDFELSGSASATQRVQLVVDGRLADAQTVEVGVDGRWLAQVDTGAMLDPQLEHRLVARDPASGAVSSAMRFRVQRQWQQLVDIADPAGDDHGRSGRYQYPTDPAFAQQRPNDIQQVTVDASGSALRVTVTLHQLLATWNPPNGFDHVAFNLYLELPAQPAGAASPCSAELAPLPLDVPVEAQGSAASSALQQRGKSACPPHGSLVMPLQFAKLPDDMQWHYRVRANGWSNALFSAAGATADRDGTPVIPTATLVADRAARTVSFTLPGAAIGNPDSLSGARIYISTWDYDGGYRDLAAQAGPYSYGGGAPDQPRVMDEVLIRLP